MKTSITDYPHATLVTTLETNWWIFALRGISALIFGCLAFAMPLATLMTITILFGAYATVDGLFFIVAGLNEAPKGRRWGELVIAGLLAIAVGLIALVSPQLATVSLATFIWSMIAMWGIATGVFQIMAAVRLRRIIDDEWLMILSGLLSVILGGGLFVLLWANPLASVKSIAFLIGISAIASGGVQLMLAFKLFKWEKNSSIRMRLA